MGNFRDLKVWQKGHQLTLGVYGITTSFPREEAYGLTAQMRSAASSICMNLAEGSGRRGDPELRRFAGIALGSSQELQYQLLLARDLDYMTKPDYEQLACACEEVSKMLTGL